MNVTYASTFHISHEHAIFHIQPTRTIITPTFILRTTNTHQGVEFDFSNDLIVNLVPSLQFRLNQPRVGSRWSVIL